MSNIDTDEAMPDITMGSTANNPTPMVDTTPTVYDYMAISPDDRARIVRLISDIGQAWNIVSPASPFPSQYHPDPDTHNWGIDLLTALCLLARITQAQSSFKDHAVHYVCSSIEERNWGLSGLHGDYVIRVEDVEYAIHRMRNRVDSYRPDRPGDRRGRTAPSSLRRGRGDRRRRG